ncbi:MAG TPA: hypothetical protein VII99_03870, partial [Bacteroidia bacterium]
MAIFIALIVILVNFGFVRYILIFIPIIAGSFYFLYNNVHEFKDRYDSTVHIFSEAQYEIGKTNGSSIILYNNYHVAMENFSNNILFGTGLGSHPIAFDKYSITKNVSVFGFALNSADANSMLLRLISETGLFGTVLMLFILFRCFISRNSYEAVTEHYWIISAAIFVMIAVNLLRQGHYFLNGFPFFVWLYYYNYINFKKYISEKSESVELKEVVN